MLTSTRASPLENQWCDGIRERMTVSRITGELEPSGIHNQMGRVRLRSHPSAGGRRGDLYGSQLWD